jgi:POLQ-like helicase
MRPEQQSRKALKITQSRAKMFEYSVPKEDHIRIPGDPAQLFPLTIGILGDAAAHVNRDEVSPDERETLQFSARFFNAYLEGQFNADTDAYLLFLASTAFYLSHVPGSSLVLAREIPDETPDLGRDGLERLLHWLLLGAQGAFTPLTEGVFTKNINNCAFKLTGYYKGEIDAQACKIVATELRTQGYECGSPRQLLFADICAALIRLRIQNSARQWLPLYSELPLDTWEGVLNKKGFLQELWPSQHILGEKGVYKGASAIVQMPTSAGKTRATELVIRSAFLANRTSLAVIVAPFRALCHEISDALKTAFRDERVSVDELTDVLQPDFDFLFSEDLRTLKKKRVLVVTPEKLLYVLRQQPEMTESIGLVIYDEGHQFDCGIRGVTYELLLTSLRRRISKDAQMILISAVISNAEAIGKWLLGENLTVANGINLSPMPRRVAFTGWSTQLGQLHFMEEDALETEDFFVPRLVSEQTLKKYGKERKVRKFPDREDSKSIALYLGIKLVSKGSVAVFCGRKDTVAGICADIVEAYDRELPLAKPLEFSTQEELVKLARLYDANLGPKAPTSRAAALGVLSHSGNTPNGIRLAVECAMKKGDAKLVICTSTLAQGVNLPIRYLIVSTVYQGREEIKARDFHNLIGRVGRAGMHVEGTILFADPKIYDRKRSKEDRWRWIQAHKLLNFKNAEPVTSSIEGLFKPFISDKEKYKIDKLELLHLSRLYIQDEQNLKKFLVEFAKKYATSGFTAKGLTEQAKRKFKVFAAIESYLMAHWEELERDGSSRALAEGTLAYTLVSDEQKQHLVELFDILAEHVRSTVPDAAHRTVFARTLQGVTTNLEIQEWITEHGDMLKRIESHEGLLRNLWPLISEGIENNTFQKIDKPEELIGVALSWIAGMPFGAILDELRQKSVKILWGTKKKELTIEQVVDICEGAFGYDGSLRIGAIADLLASQDPDDDERQALMRRLGELHKRFKYGLPQTSAVVLYECGFADRVVAQHLSTVVGSASVTRSQAISILKEQQQLAERILEKYPQYFRACLKQMVA